MVPRFRLRTLLLAVALVAVLLAFGLWCSAPHLRIRLIPGRTSGTYDELGKAVLEIQNRGPCPVELPHQSILLGLDIVVTDARGKVVAPYPYWERVSPFWSKPMAHRLGWGATHREDIHLFGTAAGGLPPGTYTVEAVYSNGRVAARSEGVEVRVLPGGTAAYGPR